MLKIKDNVDLKELEKYGFKFKRGYGYCYEYKNSETLIKSENTILKPYEDINVVCFDENGIYIHCNTHMAFIPSVIYDLIKDGLVEKVEE